MNIIAKLVDHFGDYMSAEKQPAWDQAKLRLTLGHLSSGYVILQCEFGVFVDFGEGFPGLFRVTDLDLPVIKGRDYHLDMPIRGANLTGTVIGFSDAMRQVDLMITKTPTN